MTERAFRHRRERTEVVARQALPVLDFGVDPVLGEEHTRGGEVADIESSVEGSPAGFDVLEIELNGGALIEQKAKVVECSRIERVRDEMKDGATERVARVDVDLGLVARTPTGSSSYEMHAGLTPRPRTARRA